MNRRGSSVGDRKTAREAEALMRQMDREARIAQKRKEEAAARKAAEGDLNERLRKRAALGSPGKRVAQQRRRRAEAARQKNEKPKVRNNARELGGAGKVVATKADNRLAVLVAVVLKEMES